VAAHVVMRVVVDICHVSFNLPRRRSSSPSTLTQSAAVTGHPRPSGQRSLVDLDPVGSGHWSTSTQSLVDLDPVGSGHWSTSTQSAAVTGRPRPSRQRSLVDLDPVGSGHWVNLDPVGSGHWSTSTQSAAVTGDVPRCRLVSTRSRSSAPTITSTSSSPPVRRPQVLSRSLTASNLGVVSLLLLKPQGCR